MIVACFRHAFLFRVGGGPTLCLRLSVGLLGLRAGGTFLWVWTDGVLRRYLVDMLIGRGMVWDCVNVLMRKCLLSESLSLRLGNESKLLLHSL